MQGRITRNVLITCHQDAICKSVTTQCSRHINVVSEDRKLFAYGVRSVVLLSSVKRQTKDRSVDSTPTVAPSRAIGFTIHLDRIPNLGRDLDSDFAPACRADCQPRTHVAQGAALIAVS
jgi:hypothetical protein